MSPLPKTSCRNGIPPRVEGDTSQAGTPLLARSADPPRIWHLIKHAAYSTSDGWMIVGLDSFVGARGFVW